jgi:zinc protease
MGVSFACDPKRSEELSAAVIQEIELIAGGTINEDTLGKAREAVRKTFESSMESNAYIARNYANFSTLLDLPLGQLVQRPALYAAVSAADIQGMMTKILQGGPARIILYPEGWK